MKRITFILFLTFNYCSYSQFAGGKGDGFDSAEETIIISGISQKQAEFAIYPNYVKRGTKINLNQKITGKVTFIDVLGLERAVQSSEGNTIILPNELTSGQYVLMIKETNIVYRATIMIHD